MVVMKNLHSKLEGGTSPAETCAACYMPMQQIHRKGLGKSDVESASEQSASLMPV